MNQQVVVDEWDETDKLADKYTSGIFFNLQNHGDSGVIAVRGKPLARERHWTGAGYEDCTGAGCALCAKGMKLSLRVKLNVYVVAENAMKIWEFGAQVYKDVKAVRTKYGIENTTFEVTRHGRAKDPKTKYSILPDKLLTPEQRARVDAAPLHNLAEVKNDDATDDAPGREEGPVAPEVRGEFITRLKNLGSEEALNAFLGKFSCERIGDVPASEEHNARRMIETLERQHGKPSREPEINPYS